MRSTLTGPAGGLQAGDLLEIVSPDRRLWKRGLHWLLRLDPPVERRRLVVTDVQASRMSVRDWLATDPSGRELAALLEPWPPERRYLPSPSGRDQIEARFGDLNE